MSASMDTGRGMDLSVQGMYELQEKCCESVSSRHGFIDTESGMSLSVLEMYQLQEKYPESVSIRYVLI